MLRELIRCISYHLPIRHRFNCPSWRCLTEAPLARRAASFRCPRSSYPGSHLFRVRIPEQHPRFQFPARRAGFDARCCNVMAIESRNAQKIPPEIVAAHTFWAQSCLGELSVSPTQTLQQKPTRTSSCCGVLRYRVFCERENPHRSQTTSFDISRRQLKSQLPEFHAAASTSLRGCLVADAGLNVRSDDARRSEQRTAFGVTVIILCNKHRLFASCSLVLTTAAAFKCVPYSPLSSGPGLAHHPFRFPALEDSLERF